MFDLNGGVEGDIREFLMHGANNTQRMCGAVPEIGIAKGDVLCALSYLCSNVGEHNVDGNGEETSLIHGSDGTVQAGVLTATSRFCITRDLYYLIDLEVCVAIKGR